MKRIVRFLDATGPDPSTLGNAITTAAIERYEAAVEILALADAFAAADGLADSDVVAVELWQSVARTDFLQARTHLIRVIRAMGDTDGFRFAEDLDGIGESASIVHEGRTLTAIPADDDLDTPARIAITPAPAVVGSVR